jgi:iron complex transport system ATP-binding protein
VIEFEDVGATLGDTEVFRDVSLSVPEGQFLALVGPNGAGKTTLLRTCNGLVRPTTGRVTIGGEDVTALSARELGRRVATVPQETSLGFDFDVAEVVMMGRTPHRSRVGSADEDDERAVADALERTETARFGDRPVGSLSGGERQRVRLAQALAQDTPVLLLDEPTASLDVNHQLETLSLARSLADAGRTVVAAIHDLDLSARFCDAVVLLADGRLVAHGPPADVLTADRLGAAFDVDPAVTVNPVTGTRSVTPLADVPTGDRRVHVVGTGERTARVLGRLSGAGVAVTVCVLPEGDVALPVARRVANHVVTAPAFEPVGDGCVRAARDLAAAADLAVVVGALDDANEEVVAAADRVIGVEGTDLSESVPAVPERGLIPAVRTPKAAVAGNPAPADDD